MFAPWLDDLQKEEPQALAVRLLRQVPINAVGWALDVDSRHDRPLAGNHSLGKSSLSVKELYPRWPAVRPSEDICAISQGGIVVVKTREGGDDLCCTMSGSI